MHKLIFVLSFLLASSFLIADDLPKLNLEIGKKYLIETIYHEDTSKTNNRRVYDKKRFEFEATGFNKPEGTYDIRLDLKYYLHVNQEMDKKGEWKEKEVYETGFVTTFRNPIVYLNMYLIQVKFKLSVENQTSSFDFSDFSKYKSPEGYPINIYELDQRNIENEISALFFDSKKTETFWSHKMDIRSNFKVIRSDELHSEIEVSKFSESVQNNKPASSYNQYKRSILINKTTGLIQEDRLSFKWNFMGEIVISRYQKNISAVSEKFEVMQKAGVLEYNKTEIQNPNTSIRISVQDSTEYSGYIYLTYMDQMTNSFKSFRLEKDRIGIFNFQFNLFEPQYIIIQFYPQTMDFSKSEAVYLRPGDNIEVEIRKATEPERFFFKGIGAGENRVLRTIRQLNRTKNNIGSIYYLSNDSILQLLNKEKLNINPDFYLEIYNTYIYSNYLKQMPRFPEPVEKLQIPILNTLAIRNQIYMLFLRQYVVRFMRKIRSSSTNYTNNLDRDDQNYTFGQVLFPEPILSEFLATEVENAMYHGKWENAKLLYERHKLDYSNSLRFKKTEYIYQQESLVAPGATFPIETLTDVNGKRLNLNNTKDKLVVILIRDLRIFQIKDPRINFVDVNKSWKRSENEFSDFRKDIIMVRLMVGTKKQFSDIKASLDNKSDHLVFMDIEDVYWGVPGQIPLLSKNTFVLGRKGIISFNRQPNDYELNKAIEDLKKPEPFIGKSDFVFKVIIISLLSVVLSIGLTFLLYRQITRRKLRQEELKRKMRELELTVIRTQMNPHFMYNCLNSIQNLVQKNRNEEAHLYLSKFASLVRQALNNSKKNEISLSKELDSVKEYIELEQLRFEFEFKLAVGNGINLNNIFVPPMLLQPFVENAILHGLISKKTNCILEIRILKDQNKITLVIEDNGIGREATLNLEGKGNGQGILLSANRLKLLTEKTGIHYNLNIEDLFDENKNPCGTRVSIGFIEEE